MEKLPLQTQFPNSSNIPWLKPWIWILRKSHNTVSSCKGFNRAEKWYDPTRNKSPGQSSGINANRQAQKITILTWLCFPLFPFLCLFGGIADIHKQHLSYPYSTNHHTTTTSTEEHTRRYLSPHLDVVSRRLLIIYPLPLISQTDFRRVINSQDLT